MLKYAIRERIYIKQMFMCVCLYNYMLVCPTLEVSLWNISLTCQEEEYSKSNIQISSI